MLTFFWFKFIIRIESRKVMDIKKILKVINHKNRIAKLCFMIVGVFLLALNYNLFLVKNDIVIGGVSGLAIVFHNLWGWNNQIFIYIVSFILLLISFMLFGFKKSRPAIIGTILYPVMITFTLPLAESLSEYFIFEDFITTIAFTSIVYGFASGLVYKMGYNTGGSDIVMQIMCKYLHMPEGRATFISNVVVVLFAGIVLGVNKVVYAIIILYVSSLIVDKMLIGISKSKLFIIESTEIKKLEDVIMNELKLGVTVLQAKGGYSNKKRDMLMCVVPTRDYYLFKEVILAIDKNAFLIINDCYDIEGGTIKSQGSTLSNFL